MVIAFVTLIPDDTSHNKSSNNNEKATQAYKLFSEGKKPVEVAIQLGLSEKEATKYYTEYWKLKRLYKLHSIYKELKRDLFPILKLYRILKREGIRIKDLKPQARYNCETWRLLSDHYRPFRSILCICRRENI